MAVLIAAGGYKQRQPLYSQAADGLMNAVLPLRHLSVASALQIKYVLGQRPDRQPVDTVTWVMLHFTVKFHCKTDGCVCPKGEATPGNYLSGTTTSLLSIGVKL